MIMNSQSLFIYFLIALFPEISSLIVFSNELTKGLESCYQTAGNLEVELEDRIYTTLNFQVPFFTLFTFCYLFI